MSGEETLFQSQMNLWDPESSSSSLWTTNSPKSDTELFKCRRRKWLLILVASFTVLVALSVGISSLICLLYGSYEHQKLLVILEDKTEVTFNKTVTIVKKLSGVVKDKVKELQVKSVAFNDSLDIVEYEQDLTSQKLQSLDSVIGHITDAMAAENFTLHQTMKDLASTMSKNYAKINDQILAMGEEQRAFAKKTEDHARNNSMQLLMLEENITNRLNESGSYISEIKDQIQTTNLNMAMDQLSMQNFLNTNVTMKMSQLENKFRDLKSDFNITITNWTDLLSQLVSFDLKLSRVDSRLKTIESNQEGISDKVQKLNKTMHDKINENESGSLFRSIANFGKFFKFPESRSFAEGQSACAKLGSHIVEFTNENFFAKLLALQHEYPNDPFYIGMTDEEQEGVWKFSKSNEVFKVKQPNPWNQGEPNNMNLEHCVHVIKGLGLLNDLQCSSKMPILCEKD